MEKKYVIEGYSFQNAADYERAKKERETIAYLRANTDMANMKAVYKVYQRAIEKKSFQTVFGLEFLQELRGRLIGSEIVPADVLEPVPAGRVAAVPSQRRDVSQSQREIKRYQEAYQKAKAGSMIKNFLIAVLVVVVGVMLYITSQKQYSILTYFTDYEDSIRNEIVNEYEDWESSLQQKEEELNQKQEQLEKKEQGRQAD